MLNRCNRDPVGISVRHTLCVKREEILLFISMRVVPREYGL